jgi:hypothetical protein
MPFKKVYMLPVNKALINTGEAHINSNYFKSICDIATTPIPVHHLCNKNGWDDTTCKLMHWPAFQTCKNSQTMKKKQPIKLAQNILTTCHHVKKYDTSIPPKCVFCKNKEETCDHIIQCPNKRSKHGETHSWHTWMQS